MDRWINRLIFLYLVAFPFGQLVRLPLEQIITSEINLYLTDVLVGITTIAWFLKTKVIFKIPKGLLAFPAAALFSSILATAQFDSREIFVSSLYLLRIVAYFLFAGVVFKLIKTKKEQSFIFSSLIVIGSAIAAFGLFQYFLYPDIRPLLFWGWDEHLGRVVGTFLDPNFTGIMLVLTLILITFNLKRKWFSVLWLFVFTTLLLTYSRSGYLALLAGMGTLSFLLKNPKVFFIPGVLLLVGVFFLPRAEGEGVKLERTVSANLRLENWQEAFSFIKERPLFGYGFNTLRYVRAQKELLNEEQYGPSHAAGGVDNSFLFVLTTTGVVGFLTFVSLLIKLSNHAFLIQKPIGQIFLSSGVAVVTHSMFLNTLFYPWILGWMAILTALMLKAKE